MEIKLWKIYVPVAAGAVICALIAVTFCIVGIGTNGAAADPSGTPLIFWTVDESYAAYMGECAQRFNEAYPEDRIDLNIRVYSRSFIVDQVRKSISNDRNIPDLLDIQFCDFNKFVNSAEHTLILYPLNSLVTDDSGARDEALQPFSFNDALLAVPYGDGRLALYYNAELLDACGTDRSQLNDWENFFKLGMQLRADGGPALFALDISNNDLFMAMMLQRDPTVSSASAAKILESDAFAEVSAMLGEALREGWAIIPEEFNIYNHNFFKQFLENQCLCLIAPLEYAGELMRKLPEMSGKIGIRSLPAWGEASGGAHVAQYGTAIASKSPNIALARRFLQFAKLTPDAYAAMTQSMYLRNISSDAQLSAQRPQSEEYAAYFCEIDLPDEAEIYTLSGDSGLPEAIWTAIPALLDSAESN